jgi:putative ABC transport system permease protein
MFSYIRIKILIFKEVIKEIITSISQHKVRSLLTGFGIAWGMFILILLLGAGNGLRHGMLSVFSGFAANSMWVAGFMTDETKAGGLQKGQKVEFNDAIISKLKKQKPYIDLISPEIAVRSNNTVVYKNNTGNFDIKGIGQSYMEIKQIEIGEGRNLNRLDYDNCRRNVIIGGRVKEMLFGKTNPVGETLFILGTSFRVAGVIKEGSIISMGEINSIYMPDVILYRHFNFEKVYSTFGMLLKPEAPLETVEREIRRFLAKELQINETDRKAILINNIQLQVSAFNKLFDGIDIFLWVMGICILLCGIIGIANIMLVNVKDRTQEIGIRKAIGATPDSILTMIVLESTIITLFFGLVGILLGYGGLSVYNFILNAVQGNENRIFEHAYVDTLYVVMALLVLILSGVLAGLYPAQKAVSIKPIQTLNQFV